MIDRNPGAFDALQAALVDLARAYPDDAARFVLDICDAADEAMPIGQASIRMADKVLDLRDEAMEFGL
ncbi:hypothetical protein [Belnapia sp. F-4-1]|uniref:hypothetical protein n=1 Tax=Belnapia sp. F-4-1 TaxID=1545443 RepID=UPI0005BE8F5C|nr:hypothetical protein [Belnapia sp. F-4-1]